MRITFSVLVAVLTATVLVVLLHDGGQSDMHRSMPVALWCMEHLDLQRPEPGMCGRCPLTEAEQELCGAWESLDLVFPDWWDDPNRPAWVAENLPEAAGR